MRTRTVRIIGGACAAAVLLGGAALGLILWHIHQSVGQYGRLAQEAHPHPGDDVAALVDFVKSDTHSLSDRNRAVWALGRLRDARALSALESVYTGGQCEHDRNLCQYELEKTIRLCGGVPDPPREARH